MVGQKFNFQDGEFEREDSFNNNNNNNNSGTLSQTTLGTFPIFQFLDVLLKTCSLFY